MQATGILIREVIVHLHLTAAVLSPEQYYITRQQTHINQYKQPERQLCQLAPIKVWDKQSHRHHHDWHELEKPGRDPREGAENVEFDDNVTDIKDLHEGMVLNGKVTNITQFGAFVDIGVHKEGLVHVSQMAERRVQDPSKVVKIGQVVRVRVLSVDVDRQRIALSLRV